MRNAARSAARTSRNPAHTHAPPTFPARRNSRYGASSQMDTADGTHSAPAVTSSSTTSGCCTLRRSSCTMRSARPGAIVQHRPATRPTASGETPQVRGGAAGERERAEHEDGALGAGLRALEQQPADRADREADRDRRQRAASRPPGADPAGRTANADRRQDDRQHVVEIGHARRDFGDRLRIRIGRRRRRRRRAQPEREREHRDRRVERHAGGRRRSRSSRRSRTRSSPRSRGWRRRRAARPSGSRGRARCRRARRARRARSSRPRPAARARSTRAAPSARGPSSAPSGRKMTAGVSDGARPERRSRSKQRDQPAERRGRRHAEAAGRADPARRARGLGGSRGEPITATRL